MDLILEHPKKKITDSIPSNGICEKCMLPLKSSNFMGVGCYLSTSRIANRNNFCVKCATRNKKRDSRLTTKATLYCKIEDFEKFVRLVQSMVM